LEVTNSISILILFTCCHATFIIRCVEKASGLFPVYGQQAGNVFFLSLLFFLDKKSNKKVMDKRMLRRLSGQRTGEFVTVRFISIGKGIVLDSPACFAMQRKALCPALNVFIVISVLKYGGARRWAVVLVWWYRVVTLINRQCPRRSTGQRCETWRETDIRNGRELETMAGKKF